MAGIDNQNRSCYILLLKDLVLTACKFVDDHVAGDGSERFWKCFFFTSTVLSLLLLLNLLRDHSGLSLTLLNGL